MHIITDPAEERALLNDCIRASARAGTVRVLEAGCGQRWPLKPDGVELHITGIDSDEKALEMRRSRQGDLDVAVVGDLRDVEIPSDSFDVVYCSYVLEHVEGAEQVLDRMLAAVRPGGRLIVRVPDRNSVFGWIARHTPHRTHVWFKRYIERFPDAGKPGHAPYPVVYDDVVSRAGLLEWANRSGSTVEHFYATNYVLRTFRRFASLVNMSFLVLERLSGNRLSGRWNNIGLVASRG